MGVLVDDGPLVVDTLGRVGGLLRVVLGVDLDAEVAVGLDNADVREATGLVNGRFGGMPDLMLDGFALSSERDGTLSAILGVAGRNLRLGQRCICYSRDATQYTVIS